MLFDRLKRKKIREEDISSPFVAARYKLLIDARINGHTNLAANSLLAEDGSGRFKYANLSFMCGKGEVDDNQQLVELALLQILKLIDFDSMQFPSPLLPSQLFDEEGDLNELELLLHEVNDKGHLHEISRRPRFDMRYDEMVMPVSRAKRLANSAERHLAAHSECWQRKTLSGLQPRKIMGMVSEDEFNLYENRVYVRLLDRLDRFLAKRIREIEALTKNLTEAIDLEDSDHINYRLSKKLHSIWGETFSNDSAAIEALDQLELTQKELRKQHQNIRGLIQHQFYKKIPKSAQVPGQIEQTNILSHDQHYRQLPKLWNTLRKENHKNNLTPEETLAVNIKQQEAYVSYCGSVVLRAMMELDFKSVQNSNNHFKLERAESSITIKSDGSDWEVTSDLTGHCIRLVPILTWRAEGLDSFIESNTLTIPCCLSSDRTVSHPVDWLTGKDKSPMILSPLDFYVEERVVALFSTWLLMQSAQKYGQIINQIPGSAMIIMKASPAFKSTSSKSGYLESIPTDDVLDKVKITLKKDNAKSGLASLEDSVKTISSLEYCPCCQQRGDFTQRDNKSFIAKCLNKDCQLEWEVSRLSDQTRELNIRTNDQSDSSFHVNGRWNAKIVLGDIV